MILYIISDMKVSNKSNLPMVARHEIRYDIVIAIELRYIITPIYTPVNYWFETERSVLPEGVVWLKSPMKTSNQNFWIKGLNWIFNAIVNIAVPNPNAVPLPKYESIKPRPTANKDM